MVRSSTCSAGNPAGDVLHVALHGQYDAQGDQEGIVLLAKSPAGGATAQFLSTHDAGDRRLEPAGPFVFLNACQVGTDERVLGDYGGFASTLLRIGAAGVVAPLWNVKDDVAAEVARPSTPPRSPRAGSRSPPPRRCAPCARRTPRTRSGPAPRASTPTLVAYQVFGHPRLRLNRQTAH